MRCAPIVRTVESRSVRRHWRATVALAAEPHGGEAGNGGQAGNDPPAEAETATGDRRIDDRRRGNRRKGNGGIDDRKDATRCRGLALGRGSGTGSAGGANRGGADRAARLLRGRAR